MNTRALLTLSAAVLAAAGIAGSFLPQEILAAAGLASPETLPLAVQLFAAALLGFAMMNWMARGSLIGGIYNRPLAVGNLAHFTIGALALAKALLRGQSSVALVVATLVYGAFAVAFAVVLFQSPAEVARPATVAPR